MEDFIADAAVLISAIRVLRKHSTKPDSFVMKVLCRVLYKTATGIIEKNS